MSDMCYELFEANIEGAHAFTRKALLDLTIAKLNTNQTFISLLVSMRKNFTIMNNLFHQALETETPAVSVRPAVSIHEKRQVLREAIKLLKESAKDYVEIQKGLSELTQEWLFGRMLYHIILGRLPDKLFENIEDLFIVFESALEEKGEYVTAEDILRSLR